jgi:hypothetical protein
MFRHLFTLVISALGTAGAFVFLIIPVVRENWRAQGFNEGSISASWEISEKLEKEFPKKPSNCESGRILFEVKSTSVYVLDCPQGKRIYVAR